MQEKGDGVLLKESHIAVIRRKEIDLCGERLRDWPMTRGWKRKILGKHTERDDL